MRRSRRRQGRYPNLSGLSSGITPTHLEGTDRLLHDTELAGVPITDIIGSGWTVGRLDPWRDGNGKVIGYFGRLELAAPLASDGPWRYLECGNTQYADYREPYRHVERLSIAVSADQTRLFQLGPVPETIGVPGASGIRESSLPWPVGDYTLYDREFGDEIGTFDLDGTDLDEVRYYTCAETREGGR